MTMLLRTRSYCNSLTGRCFILKDNLVVFFTNECAECALLVIAQNWLVSFYFRHSQRQITSRTPSISRLKISMRLAIVQLPLKRQPLVTIVCNNNKKTINARYVIIILVRNYRKTMCPQTKMFAKSSSMSQMLPTLAKMWSEYLETT